MSRGKNSGLYFQYCVPHGSVLEPILFTLYTAPLSDVIAEHDVEHHLYADYTQIYIYLSGSEALWTYSRNEAKPGLTKPLE